MELSKFKVCNNIANLRIKHDLTQDELAILIGVSKNAISDYETNKYCPSIKSALLLCYVFNCDIEDIFFIKIIDND